MSAGLFSRVGKLRRKKIESICELETPKVLEIGAFDNATFWRQLGDNVKYMDFFSRSELLEMHQKNPRRRFDKIVEVDYVVKTNSFSHQVGDNYDIVVANHVVEHIPNLVDWLIQISKILRKGGVLFLSIPDKQYTFDYYRPLTTWADVIRAYYEMREKPDLVTIAEAKWYHTHIDKNALWERNAPPPFRQRLLLSDALAHAEKNSQQYTDTHCWVFTPTSFATLMDDLSQSGLINLELMIVEETAKNYNEFYAVLKKGD